LQIQAALVADFGMALDDSAVVLKQGGSQAVNVSINPINGFGDSVLVSIKGLPSGVTVAPSSSFRAPAGSQTAITFTAAKNAPAGTAAVTFTGTDGSLNHTQTAFLQVLAGATATVSVAYFDDTAVATTPTPDSFVRIVNSGTQSTASQLGDLCANIYVFDAHQELAECCSCAVTANGFIQLSLFTDLVNNSLPGNFAAGLAGSVDVVPSTLSSTTPCDPTSFTPVPNALDVWGTRPAILGKLVETRSPTTVLSGPELTELQSRCGFIVSNSSGAGICSCPATI
jgi:hypothetical protein